MTKNQFQNEDGGCSETLEICKNVTEEECVDLVDEKIIKEIISCSKYDKNIDAGSAQNVEAEKACQNVPFAKRFKGKRCVYNNRDEKTLEDYLF